MERVSSRQNAVVKRFRELARASRSAAPIGRGVPHGAGGHAGEILLDGEHLVAEALACDVPVELAAFSDRQLGDAQAPLHRLADDVQARGGRAILVSDQVLAAISPVEHPSGVVAIARARATDVGVVFAAAVGAGSQLPLVVVLAGLQDPGNVGAIVRAAAAFGAAGVAAIDGTANPFGWKALRGAMGGTFRLPVAARGSAADVIAAAGDRRVRLVAAVPRGGTPLPRLDFRQPTALVLGAEGAGVSGAMVSAAHESVTIPMRAPVESLNVAVAAALLLYEASRQYEP
ncbi:MAG TPA: RNA methyltransferase [Vicinamibacterales bacterium]|jgi:TrmH family RNA methyltransferase